MLRITGKEVYTDESCTSCSRPVPLRIGIDAEFSRPGVEALLAQFEEAVGELESGDYSFKWKPGDD
jgi:hypothetical protein